MATALVNVELSAQGGGECTVLQPVRLKLAVSARQNISHEFISINYNFIVNVPFDAAAGCTATSSGSGNATATAQATAAAYANAAAKACNGTQSLTQASAIQKAFASAAASAQGNVSVSGGGNANATLQAIAQVRAAPNIPECIACLNSILPPESAC